MLEDHDCISCPYKIPAMDARVICSFTCVEAHVEHFIALTGMEHYSAMEDIILENVPAQHFFSVQEECYHVPGDVGKRTHDLVAFLTSNQHCLISFEKSKNAIACFNMQ